MRDDDTWGIRTMNEITSYNEDNMFLAENFKVLQQLVATIGDKLVSTACHQCARAP